MRELACARLNDASQNLSVTFHGKRDCADGTLEELRLSWVIHGTQCHPGHKGARKVTGRQGEVTTGQRVQLGTTREGLRAGGRP